MSRLTQGKVHLTICRENRLYILIFNLLIVNKGDRKDNTDKQKSFPIPHKLYSNNVTGFQGAIGYSHIFLPDGDFLLGDHGLDFDISPCWSKLSEPNNPIH